MTQDVEVSSAGEEEAGQGAGAAYILRARFPGAPHASLRSCGSALRVLQLEAECRSQGMWTEITTPDGQRLNEDQLGSIACGEALRRAEGAAWGWWTIGRA